MLHALANGNWFAMFLFWSIVWIAILAVGILILARIDGGGDRHDRPRRA